MRGTALGALLRGDRRRSAVRVTSMRTSSPRNRQRADDLELPAAFVVLSVLVSAGRYPRPLPPKEAP
jgi:hypothetical protein